MLPSRRVFLAGLGAPGPVRLRQGQSRVRPYCAQDREFAVGVLGTFRERTGLEVVPKFDTEANKSVSLYTELVAEKDRPRCDVFWNNEILSTIRLQHQGLLEGYESPSRETTPRGPGPTTTPGTPSPRGRRVLIVNTDLVPGERPAAQPARPDRPALEGQGGHGPAAVRHHGDAGGLPVRGAGQGEGEEFYLRPEGQRRAARAGQQAGGRVGGAGRTPRGQGGRRRRHRHRRRHRRGEGRPAGAPSSSPTGAGRRTAAWARCSSPTRCASSRAAPTPTGRRSWSTICSSAEVEEQLAEGPSHQIPLNPEVKAKLPAQIETPANASGNARSTGRRPPTVGTTPRPSSTNLRRMTPCTSGFRA